MGRRVLGWMATTAIVGAIVLEHAGGSMARHVGALAAVQAAGSGVLLWSGLPERRRWLGLAAGAVLLAGVALGGPPALAGLSHAMLYGVLLVVFGRTLLPGRIALVTTLARRLNRRFRPAMVPYTRGVTLAWCGFAALQLALSAALLAAGAWAWWSVLTGWGHAVLAAALGLGEYALRCRRFPGEHTGFMDTIRGLRSPS